MAPAQQLAPPAPATAIGAPVVLGRTTRDGRKLWYETTVLQQPERARACGSGPKSSADRRPIDPPPVVQIKIFEGPTRKSGKDITFLYNADFFLYATLEHARPMAHGRGAPQAPATPPVLTGMPVSSVCYLDRPQEAGYFLFPDLSVRHEGVYHLTFSLMEETKEDRDKDPEEPNQGADEITGPEGRNFDFRMTVRTDDFTVFSAKKFPGLTESTTLSRTVAEQGCRVRIRRDVRMRKRPANDKPRPTEAIDAANEQEYNRRRSGENPAHAPNHNPQHFRARSASQASMDRSTYGNDAHRRPSGPDYAPQPPYSGQDPSATRRLHFGPNGPYSHPQQGPSVPASPSYPQRIAAQGTDEGPYARRPSYHTHRQETLSSQQHYQSSPLQQQFPPLTASSIEREAYTSSHRRTSSSDHSQHLSPAEMKAEPLGRKPEQPTQEKCPVLPSLPRLIDESSNDQVMSEPSGYPRSASVADQGQHRPFSLNQYRTRAPTRSIAPAPAESKKRTFEEFSPRQPEPQRYTNGLRENSPDVPRPSAEGGSREEGVNEAPYELSTAEYDRASGSVSPVAGFPGCFKGV